ncbi:Transposon Tf2-1 polyprotein [Trametes pubescens]|uniref:Transposon Tf2-1 polyprotein n=1 Tax=Trametes pubescens TaxID=154538 RepID=A0A1M2VDJ3_TRAPU|nr:Transposon Tf2-1 polyprotein [Trametes pubescens]
MPPQVDTQVMIKTPRHKPFGLLHPLDIPDHPWKSITMDHIMKLPLSHGYDLIWVMCDRLMRYAHFIPCNKAASVKDLTWLFLDRIFRYHGLPDSIISDHSTTFVSQFWTELTRLLQVELKHSTAYHPQTDSLTKCMNQMLESYLRAYVSYQQDDWVDYLLLAEFAFNNHINTSTKQTLFYANFGFHPVFSPCLTEPICMPAAADLALRLTRVHDELRAELHKTILDARKTGQRCEYLVHWHGLSEDDNSWLPLTDIPATSNELLDRFHRHHPRAPHPPDSVLYATAHTTFDKVSNAHSPSSASSPQVPSSALPSASPPLPPPTSSLTSPATAPTPFTPRPAAILPARPCAPSPPPVHTNPRVKYVPPVQTTLRSGRVSQPHPRRDA